MCDSYASALSYAGHLKETIQCKKAAIVAVFFVYILLQVVTGAIHFLELRKKEEKAELIKGLRGFKRDIEQLSFFYLCFALLIQIITPVPVGVVLLYIYLLTFPLLLLGHLNREKFWKMRLIGIAVQIFLMIIIIFWVLINPWCRHYYFRYMVGVPPNYTGVITPPNNNNTILPGVDNNTNNTNLTPPTDNSSQTNDTNIPIDENGLSLLL